jgi:DNA-binding SARP family transcriptional activator
VKFGLLGTTMIRGACGDIEVTSAQSRIVLALLLERPGVAVPTYEIIDALWPPEDPASPKDPANAIQQIVRNLRRVLGDRTLIECRAPGYLIKVDPGAVDVARFRGAVARARGDSDDHRRVARLREALGLWRGDPLADIASTALDMFRQRLAEERIEAFDLCVEAELRLGRHKEVVAELIDWVARYPFKERLHYHLILARYRCDGEVEALRAFQRCREVLIDELGAEPGAEVQSLRARILRKDPTLTAPEPADETRAPTVRCEQLPLLPRGFVGRMRELSDLTGAVDEAGDAGRVWVVSGPGGIGKTWLATHWAHYHQHRFPDGRLFLDLQGHSPGGRPLSTGAALRGFLDAFGVDPRRIPAEPHAQIALWRSLVYGKRMLLVLDNAADADQVADLLPGSATCTVLITSRDQLTRLITAYGAHHLPLTALTEHEARSALTARAGHARLDTEPAAVRELLRHCAGYPLALGIVAGRLQTEPTTSLTALAAELRDERLSSLDDDDPRASLSAVLSWSYHALSTDEARAFGLLGSAPGTDISTAAAASLLGLPLPQTTVLLRGLVEHSLLLRTSTGRLRMHDLIRAYAVDRDRSPEDGDAALRRVIAHYLHTAYAADHLLHPPRPVIPLAPAPADCVIVEPAHRTAAVAWFEAEHRCLLAAQRTAADIGWNDAGWQLSWAMHTFHHRRGHRRDHLASWRIGRDCAETGDAAVRSLVLRLHGGACARAGEHDDAQRSLRLALALAEQANDVAGQAHTHWFIAWYWAQHEDSPQALTHATAALALLQGLDNPLLLGQAFNLAGWCAAQTGDLHTGRERCETALELARKHGDRDGEAATLDSLGFIANAAEAYQNAVQYYEQAAELLGELDNTYAQADTFERLAETLNACGDASKARSAWRQALALYHRQLRGDDARRVERTLATAQYSERSS